MCVKHKTIQMIVSLVESIFKRKFLSLDLYVNVNGYIYIYIQRTEGRCVQLQNNTKREKREEKTNADSVERCGSCSLTSLVNLFSQPSVHLVRMYVEWMRRRTKKKTCAFVLILDRQIYIIQSTDEYEKQ